MADERTTPTDPSATGPAPGPEIEVFDTTPGAGAAAVAMVGVSRRRWVVAALVTAGVLIAAVLVASLLAGRSTPEVLRYVPADALLVVELRPELPGDQHAKVGELLSHFPGFADQSTLDQKIDESLDLLIDRASGGTTDYTTEVKPLLAGPAVVAVTAFPRSPADYAGVVAILTTDGTQECLIPNTELLRTEDYRGLTLHLSTNDIGLACAFDGRFAIVGGPGAVRAAIDTRRDGGSIVDDASYRAAQGALTGDHLAAGYMNLRALLDDVMSLGDTPVASALPVDEVPQWLAFHVRAEDDALVFDAVAPIPVGAPAAAGPDHRSALAERLPGSVVVSIEGHDVGLTISQALAQLKAEPATAAIAKEIEDAAKTIGGVDGLTGWMGDFAVVVTLDGDQLGGGIVIEATDRTKAAAALASVHNLLVLAGTGSEIHLDQVDHAGTTINVLDLGDLGSILGAPDGSTVGGAPAFSIAWTQRDDLIVIGVGQSFVESVLDTSAAHSLAHKAGYVHAMDRAGAVNSGQGYVDLGALIEYAGTQIPNLDATRWTTDIEPWVHPFDSLAFSSSRDGDQARARLVITVR